jgi:hypothetical protein
VKEKAAARARAARARRGMRPSNRVVRATGEVQRGRRAHVSSWGWWTRTKPGMDAERRCRWVGGQPTLRSNPNAQKTGRTAMHVLHERVRTKRAGRCGQNR